MRRKRVIILGATGSIGQSALAVARAMPEQMEVVGISSYSNTAQLIRDAQEFSPSAVCVKDAGEAKKVRQGLGATTRVLHGEEGLIELACLAGADLVLVAIVGTVGLKPALAAIRAGKDLAVASKEILVAAGPIIMAAARQFESRILPVDSEHNAIFQCLEGRNPESVSRLILTCSGGPFRELSRDQFDRITPDQALRHPTWSMGRKITIDSATLFNKGLEMIEARWLFDLPMERVDVVIHPQSIVHSMVEFCDGSILAQLSHSDMRFPIQYAITWPERLPSRLPRLDLAELGRLDFFPPRNADFPALQLARQAGLSGGVYPAALNAANEVAVDAFLQGQIRFPQIWETVDRVLQQLTPPLEVTLESIIAADQEARHLAANDR